MKCFFSQLSKVQVILFLLDIDVKSPYDGEKVGRVALIQSYLRLGTDE